MDAETDRLVRLTAFSWLDDLRARFGDTVARTELEQGFRFRGDVVRVIGPQGIFIPRGMAVPLSITTVPAKPGRPPPYEDVVGPDGLLRYKYRGQDPAHRENVGLREAMARGIPLVYFWGITPGRYQPAWPAFVRADDPATETFTVGFDAAGSLERDLQAGIVADDEARRAYVTEEVLRRVHQSRFSERVIAAYRCRCAICRLGHRELLDAAHILPDAHPRGEPITPNGLALCKIHHAAFDRNLLGVRPNLVVEVKSDILEEQDGPMLRWGLQACNGQKLAVTPHRALDKPRAEFLEERFEIFKQAG